jgi:hypothetical protein
MKSLLKTFFRSQPQSTQPAKFVIYTAISPGYDRLSKQPPEATAGCDLVAFLGDRPRMTRGWRIAPLSTISPDNKRNIKIHKVLSHQFFPKAEYSLWMDGNVDLSPSTRMEALIAACLRDADLAVFLHPHRDCLYREAEMCLEQNLDDIRPITQQVVRYTREGYPANNGLVETSAVLRRHTPKIAAFNEAWWAEIQAGSRRDQLSFNYVAQKCSLRLAFFPGDLHNGTPLFHRRKHANAQNRVWSHR